MRPSNNLIFGVSPLNCFEQFGHLHGYYGAEVSGSTIGIVGMGKIGYAVARRANGFGMKVIYHNRKRRETDEKQFGKKHINVFP